METSIEELAQSMANHDKVIHSFATPAKIHVEKAMDDWKV